MPFVSADILNFDFIKWELIALAFLLLVAALVWRGKGIKQAGMFLLVTLVLFTAYMLCKYLVFVAFEDPAKAIDLGVAWVPTGIFVFIVFFYTIFGVTRGLRKSAILWVQSAAVALACLGLFFFCVKSEAMDKFIVKAVNLFMGDGGIQSTLGVSAECVTARQILAEYIPSLASDYGAEISIVLAENGAYLMTLVDMAFRIVFAIVILPIYFLLEFILYIIYLCAYSERKYKRRKGEAVTAGKADRSYKKHSVWGGVIGFFRGTAVGLVAMSMLGFVLYIGAGGTGDGKLKDCKFGNDGLDFGYSVYRSIESYGDNGIFKLLNMFKGTDDSPYYLFAADLIFSGKLEDENAGISENIKLRKELGAYSGFARDTMNLLLKHGEEKIKPILLGNSDGAMDKILDVMTLPAFQEEFEVLIDGFEAQTYIINFALSAVNSIVGEIDNTSFAGSLGETNCDMLKLLFKPGYLSPRIPDEASGATGKNQPCISVANVFRRSDAKVVYRLVVDILTNETQEDASNTEKVMSLAEKLIPQIQRLSLLDTDRSSELDPVLGRLYCFLANVYLNGAEGDEEAEPAAAAQSEGVLYRDIANAKVKWVSELNALTTVALDGIEFYGNMDRSEGKEALDIVLWMFDGENSARARNLELYDSVSAAVGDSRLMGLVMDTPKMHGVLEDLMGSFSVNMYVPDDIEFANVYDSSGNFIEYGELYNLMSGLRMLCAEPTYRDMINVFRSESPEFDEVVDALQAFTYTVEGYVKTLSGYVTDSKLLRSVVSSFLVDSEDICVPYSVCEAGTDSRVIKKEVLQDLFDCFADGLLSEQLKLLKDDAEVADILKNDVLMSVFERGNGLLEGTLACTLLNNIGDEEQIVIPSDLKLAEGQSNRDINEGWLTNGRNTPGEVRRLIAAVRTVDIDALFGEGESDLTDVLLNTDWNEDGKIDKLLASRILHYTVSNYVLSDDFNLGDEFKLIIPNAALGEDGITDTLLVKQTELKNIVTNVSSLGIDGESDAVDILRSVHANKGVLDSFIISASLAHYMAEKEDFLDMPRSYRDMADESWLKENDRAAEMWKGELGALLDAIDALFDLDSESLELTDEALEQKLKERIKDFNELDPDSEKYGTKSRLEYCCDSDIVLYNITLRLDESMESWGNINKAEPNEDGSYDPLFTPDLLNQNAKMLGSCYGEDHKYIYLYRREELASLVYAAEIFEMDDIFDSKSGDDAGGSSDSLKEKIENNLLDLNSRYKDGEDTKLGKIYGSFIIRLGVSNETDVAIDSEKAEKSTRDSIKTSEGTYSEEEMSALISALNEILVDKDGNPLEGTLSQKVDSAKGNFSDIKFLSERLKDIYVSKLVGACITKQIDDATAGTMLVHHEKAYMRDYRIYERDEVQALLNMISDNTDTTSGGTVEFTDFTLGNVNALKYYVGARLEGSDEPISYLIAASLTAYIASAQMVIPMSAVYEGVIKPSEMGNLLDAYNAIVDGDDIDDEWGGIQTLPDSATFGIIVESEVMRATVSDKIRSANSAMHYVRKGGAYIAQVGGLTTDNVIAQKGETVIIGTEQLGIMLKVLDSERPQDGTSAGFGMPDFNRLRTLDETTVYEYAKCDMLRYQISEMLSRVPDIERFGGGQEDVINIVSGVEEQSYGIPAENLYKAIQYAAGMLPMV